MAGVKIHFVSGNSKYIKYDNDPSGLKAIIDATKNDNCHATLVSWDKGDTGCVIIWQNVTHIEYDF
jgi:hypothetical protein